MAGVRARNGNRKGASQTNKNGAVPKKSSAQAAKASPAQSVAAASPTAVRRGPFWWFFRLLRVVMGLSAVYLIYTRRIRNGGTAPDLSYAPPATTSASEDFPPVARDDVRREAIREAFRHSYSAYERDGFGSDDYHPISRHGTNMSSAGGVGYLIVDVLDSLILFGMDDEYERAKSWVADLSFAVDDWFHVFEITIRVLGGLLSAHSLRQDQMLLDKAVELADRLLPAFDTPYGIPNSFVNLAKGISKADKDNYGWSSIAEVGTLQLEFKYLSELTGNPVYWQKVEAVMTHVRKLKRQDGLVPIFISPATGNFTPSPVRLGSRGDSYYEYLGKQYLQTNKTELVYQDMHFNAMYGIKHHLMARSVRDHLLHTVELSPFRTQGATEFKWRTTAKQDHLVCFLGATLMLGATDGKLVDAASSLGEHEHEDFLAGQQLTKTCVDTYAKAATGLAPEIVVYYSKEKGAQKAGRDWYIASRKPGKASPPPIDARNILRPETVESLFVAYRTTGNPIFREWGWQIFQAFEKHCKIETGGYASILDVDQVPVVHEDRMETFWLSETLKYLYLLYSEPELLPLTDWVFNTEAHPLPVFTPTVMSPIDHRALL